MEPKATALPNIPVAAVAEQSDSVKRWREQIDRITYLASLASKFSDVDPMVDDLRSITAIWDGSSSLDPSQERKLNDIEARLKQYLITSDPIRTFTAESLEQQLAERVRKGTVNPAMRSVVVILLISLAAAGLSYLPFIPLSTQNRSFMAIPLFFTVLSVGISWLYLTTLKNFNQEIRTAFKFVSVGVMAWGLAYSQYAAIGAFHLDRYQIFQFTALTGLIALPYLFIYLGMRLYAKQLGVQSWVLKLPIVAAGCVAVIIVLLAAYAVFAPALPIQNQLIAQLQNVGSFCFLYFSFVATVVTRKIRKLVTPTYAKPMNWMYVYLAANFVTAAIANLPFSFDQNGGGTPLYVLMVVFGVPDHLLLLMTGYSFKKELSK